MRTFTTFLLFFAFSAPVVAQTWLWDTLIPGYGASRFSKDKYGNIYAFNHGDLFQKMDYQGNVKWSHTLPFKTKVLNICTATDSSVFMVGLFSNTLTIGANTVISKGNEDMFISKWTSGGAIVWLKSIGSKWDEMMGDIACSDNKVWVTGAIEDTAYFPGSVIPKSKARDLFVATFSYSGILDKILWGSQIPNIMLHGNECYGQEIELDNSGNPHIIYRETSPWHYTFDTTFLMKLDTNLKVQWRYPASDSYTGVRNLTLNSVNEILYTQNGSYYASGAGADWSSIHRVSASGVHLSAFHLPKAGQIMDIDLDSCNNVYYTGYQRRNYVYASNVVNYLVVGQHSPDLTLNWMRADSAKELRCGLAIASESLNKCFVAGYFTNKLYLTDTLIQPSTTPSTAYFQAGISAIFGVPLNITPSGLLQICEKEKTQLTCSTAGAIYWYSGPTATTALFTGNTYTTPPLTAGTYTVYAEARTCTMVTARIPITVTVQPLPNVTVNSGTICHGQSFTLQPNGASSYSFNGHPNVVNPLITTSYTIIGTDSNMCRNSAVSTVTVKSLPSLSFQSNPQNLCVGETVTITASGAQQYLWSTGSTQNQIALTPTAMTTIWVQATDADGCSNTVSYTQTLKNCTATEDEHLGENFSMYPNPVNDNLNVYLRSESEISISNCAGQEIKHLMLEAGHQEINMGEIAKGIYFIHVQSPNSSYIKKIILQ